MFTIEKMEEKHLDMVFEIEKNCFVTPWTYDALKKELAENKLATYLVALKDEEVVGYAGMWHVVNEGHITNIAVKEEYRRKGVGTMILDAFVDQAYRLNMIGITLEVRVSNLGAQRMYTKLGFKPEGFRKNYYADTKEDAIIMWKYL